MKHQTLFLDRDGVINRQIKNGYVTRISEFEFLPGVLDALARLASQFKHIFIVTNQQGIGKGIFSLDDLESIHKQIILQIEQSGGRIDRIYVAPELESKNSINRKPSSGMALQAQREYPEVNFKSSVMIGDSFSDMQFGKVLGMKTVYLTNGKPVEQEIAAIADEIRVDLAEYSVSD